jgi:hypothetical protein
MDAHTIHRDPTGGPAPAEHGTGPAAHPGGPSPGGGTAPTDPFEAFKNAVNHHDRGDATTKWGALKSEEKAKLGSESVDFQKSVIRLVHHDAAKMLKAGNCDITQMTHTIFQDAEFDQWLPEMRTHGLLTPFLNAEPKKGMMPRSYVNTLEGWVDTATDIREGTAIFEHVYPTLLNGVTLDAGSTSTTC